MLTTIPFQGFYNSVHDSNIDQVIELAASNESSEVNQELIDQIMMQTDFKTVHLAYAQEYLKEFSSEIQIDLKFIELNSPKYYNYTTDRIFAEISEDSVLMMWSKIDRNTLNERIHERFTSGSGFISHYPNDLDRWPESVLKWDANQIGTLLECYAESIMNWSNDKEVYLIDSPYEIVMPLLNI